MAATKLAAVLEELQKTFLAYESEVVRFLAITLEPGPKLREDRAALYSLESQALWARIHAARGHCHKIANIHTKYLDPWFQRVTELNKDEREQLAALFASLSNSDSEFLIVFTQAAFWLSEKAKQVLDLFESGQIDQANAVVAAARQEIRPLRDALNNTMAKLRTLESEFIAMSGVT
jgi:hypothetical protein